MGKGYRIGILIPVALAAAAVIFWGRDRQVAVPDATTAQALPRLLDLGSKQCVPCKQMEPILAELGRDYAGRMEVVFIDVRENRQAATDYGIRLIPTQIFFDAEGTELSRHEGFFGRDDILGTWLAHGIEFGVGASAEER